MTLPSVFLERPIAHRALHDVNDGRPENSRAAIEAAIARGYGIEIDLQLSRDDRPMVFHDYALERLSLGRGAIRQQTAEALAKTQLIGGAEGIPSFDEVLDLVAGRVPLLVELKDQDGAMQTDIGPLERGTCAALSGYDGPVALMSFNPHSVALCAELAPDIPRGLVTCAFSADDWPTLPESRRTELAKIGTLDQFGGSFVSHDRRALDMPRIAALKEQGHAVLTWTIRSHAEETEARRIAQNITFEGYLA